MLKAQTANDRLFALLQGHPKVEVERSSETEPILRFQQGAWDRSISIHPTPSGEGGRERGHHSLSENRPEGTEPSPGITEIIDNNPLVCADHTVVPGPAGTLAWIALAPLVQAGLVAEAPTILTNAPGSEDEIDQELALMGWAEGATYAQESVDLDGVYAMTAIVAVRTPEDLNELDEIYEERFGRSFFVRRDENSPWDAELVRGKPLASYRLRVNPDYPLSLLTIQVMADAHGKCGEAQVVHRLNVMAGFEESLGLKD